MYRKSLTKYKGHFIKYKSLFFKSEVKMGVFEMSTYYYVIYYMCNFSLTTQFADVEPTKKSLLRKKPFFRLNFKWKSEM